VSGVLGLAVRGSASPVLTSISFVLLGGLVASDARLPLGTTTMLAALLGLVHGYLNGAAMAQPGLGTLGLVGIVSGLFTLIALAASFVEPLRAAWARVVVRVAGSWIAAIGLLLLGWGLRPRVGPVGRTMMLAARPQSSRLLLGEIEMLGRNPLDAPILPRRYGVAGPLVALQRRSDGAPESCLDQP
jgi:hypothetical protein